MSTWRPRRAISASTATASSPASAPRSWRPRLARACRRHLRRRPARDALPYLSETYETRGPRALRDWRAGGVSAHQALPATGLRGHRAHSRQPGPAGRRAGAEGEARSGRRADPGRRAGVVGAPTHAARGADHARQQVRDCLVHSEICLGGGGPRDFWAARLRQFPILGVRRRGWARGRRRPRDRDDRQIRPVLRRGRVRLRPRAGVKRHRQCADLAAGDRARGDAAAHALGARARADDRRCRDHPSHRDPSPVDSVRMPSSPGFSGSPGSSPSRRTRC